MHRYHCIQDLSPLMDTDPDLWREMFGFMSVCLYEDEEADLQFQIATEVDQLASFTDPEEWAVIEIHSFEGTRKYYRVVFTTEVLFVPSELAAHLSFIPDPF